MNLVWNRSLRPRHSDLTNINKAADTEPKHWAEIILARLQRPEELSNAIRSAFPQQQFADQFAIKDIHHIPGRTLKIIAQFFGNSEKSDYTVIHLDFQDDANIQAVYADAKKTAITPDRIALVINWNAVARIFPEDANLPGLATMTDMKKVAGYLGESISNPNEASWLMFSYQFGIRCAFGYHFKLSDKRYFGKIQDSEGATAAHQRLMQLWHSPGRRFQIAQPIACEQAIGARWESFVEGNSLEATLATSDLAPVVNLIVANLSFLHEQNIPQLPLMNPETLTLLLKKKVLRRMGVVLPDLVGRAEILLNRLQQHFSWSNCNQNVTLHGDFHIANFLLNDKGLVMLDLDNLCQGSPCYDLALFGSRLLLRNLHHNDRLPETLDIVAQLPNLYTKVCGLEVRKETYAWYLSAFLVARQIKVCMSNNAPNINELASKLLDWAEISLDCAELKEFNLK